MSNKDELLETIAKAVVRIETSLAENGTKLDRVERSVSELKVSNSELKRDTGRLILRVGDLEDAVRSEQQFTSDLYDQHSDRNRRPREVEELLGLSRQRDRIG